MKTEHTPGPWISEPESTLRVAETVRTEKGRWIADCLAGNGKLIAAAPELLETLKGAIEELCDVHELHVWPEGDEGFHDAARGHYVGTCTLCRKIKAGRAVISKATGK